MVKEITPEGNLGSQYKKPTREEKATMSSKELLTLPEQVLSNASNQFVGLHNIFRMLQRKPEKKEIVNEFEKMINELKEFDEYVDANYTDYIEVERQKIAENVKINYQNFFERYNTCVRMLKDLSKDNNFNGATRIFEMVEILIADIREIEQSE